LLAHDTQNPLGETAEIVDYVADFLAAPGGDIEHIAPDAAKPNLVVTIENDGEHRVRRGLPTASKPLTPRRRRP
jgi:hypothetical protein